MIDKNKAYVAILELEIALLKLDIATNLLTKEYTDGIRNWANLYKNYLKNPERD